MAFNSIFYGKNGIMGHSIHLSLTWRQSVFRPLCSVVFFVLFYIWLMFNRREKKPAQNKTNYNACDRATMVFLSSPHTQPLYRISCWLWTKLRNYFVHRGFLCVLRTPHSCCWLHSSTHSVLHESKATIKKNRSFETNNFFQFYLFADQQIHQFYTQPRGRARERD